ncbi:MAG: 30S ribosomal protein S6 [Ignavibacteriaceae bacterium]
MRTNLYESAVMINAALDDDQIEGVISRIKETINNNGGEIRDMENWGRKRLAYVVKKSKVGYYVIFRFNAQSSLIAKLERFYLLDEQILRFLTIILDSDAIEHIEKNKNNSLVDVVPEAKPDLPIIEEVEENSKDTVK